LPFFHIQEDPLPAGPFNLVMNMAGLLTCVLSFTFPPFNLGSGIRSNDSRLLRTDGKISVPIRHSLQLREQFRIFTEFPFNSIPIKLGIETKIRYKTTTFFGSITAFFSI
jgi:hypothetical protein